MTTTMKTWPPPSDIYEMEDAYTIVVDVPGATQKDVEVELDRNLLTVSAKPAPVEQRGKLVHREYEPGEYRRAFTLGSGIDREGVSATVKEGVLTLRLPKAKEILPRKISISVG